MEIFIVKSQQVSLNRVNKVLSKETWEAALTLGQDCCAISFSIRYMEIKAFKIFENGSCS